MLQLKQVVSTIFDLPFLKPLEAQLKPARAFFEQRPVYLLGMLTALLLLPVAWLLTSRIGSKTVSLACCSAGQRQQLAAMYHSCFGEAPPSVCLLLFCSLLVSFALSFPAVQQDEVGEAKKQDATGEDDKPEEEEEVEEEEDKAPAKKNGKKEQGESRGCSRDYYDNLLWTGGASVGRLVADATPTV